jgi:hypothetical protein
MPLPAPVMMTDLPSRRPMRFSLFHFLWRLPSYGIQDSFKMKSLEAMSALTYSGIKQY